MLWVLTQKENRRSRKETRSPKSFLVWKLCGEYLDGERLSWELG